MNTNHASDWLPPLGDSAAEERHTDGEWRGQLLKGAKGTPLACLQNALVALRLAPEWKDVLHFDENALTVVAQRAPPWESRSTHVWRDDDDVRTAAWMQEQGIMVSREVAGQAVQAVARERPFHPIREYLSGLHWDKISRIDDWLTLYLGADASEYTRAIGAKWLIGAVARIFKPGCKNDTCLVLEGPQGTLKSTALKTLGSPWFTDEISDLGSKDSSIQVRGVWIIELAELDAMGRPEASRTKAFMSRSADRYRPPYGRHPIEVPRESVFAGTVNHDTYLKDETGGRRFWPVRCSSIKIDSLKRDKDQLWAEAVVRFRAGEPWWIDSAALLDVATEEQQERYDEDPWQPLIAEWIESREYVTVDQILGACLEKQARDRSHGDKARVGRCLRVIGWSRKRAAEDNNGRREWQYWPGPVFAAKAQFICDTGPS
jgi:predicted P-loop ATPase